MDVIVRKKKLQETNITFARVFSKLSSSSLIISLIFFSLSFNSGNTSPINWTKTFTSLFKNIIISIVNHVSTLRDMHIKKNQSRVVDWMFYQRQIHFPGLVALQSNIYTIHSDMEHQLFYVHTCISNILNTDAQILELLQILNIYLYVIAPS